MQFLVGLVTSYLGAEYCSNIDINFEEINQKDISIIKIRSASNPVFVKSGELREFYVRSLSTTKLLNSEETYKYILNYQK